MQAIQKKDSKTLKQQHEQNSDEKKRFIVRKYIMAKSALEAISLDKKAPVDDVWIDEKWQDENIKNQIGFREKR